MSLQLLIIEKMLHLVKINKATITSTRNLCKIEQVRSEVSLAWVFKIRSLVKFKLFTTSCAINSARTYFHKLLTIAWIK